MICVAARRVVPVWLLVTMVLVAATAWATPGAAAASPQVLVVGDSAAAAVPAYGKLGALQTQLAGWQVTFEAAADRSTPAAIQSLRVSPARFEVVVVALGENDSPDIFAAEMKSMMAALATVPKVYWLTLRTAPGYPAFPKINATIRQMAAGYPNLVVADWDKFGTAHAADFYPDGIHLTAAGAADMSAFLADLVNGNSAYATAPTTTTAPATASRVVPPASAAATVPGTTATAIPPSARGRDTSTGPRRWKSALLVAVALLLAAGIVAAGRARRRRRFQRAEHARRVRSTLAMIAYDATHDTPESTGATPDDVKEEGVATSTR